MKYFTLLFLSFSLFFTSEINAQSFDIGMLDKASTLLKSGNQKESGDILSKATALLTTNAKSQGGDFAPKLLSQVGALDKVLPALANGTANIGKVQQIISTIKMISGAMNLGSMVKSGNLLGNSKSLLSNVNVLQSGMSLLGEGAGVNTITKSLGKVVKKAPKLEKTGLFANLAQKAVGKKLDSSLGLISGLL